MNAVLGQTIEQAATRLGSITTNDNVRAFALHQRFGMDLRRVVCDG